MLAPASVADYEFVNREDALPSCLEAEVNAVAIVAAAGEIGVLPVVVVAAFQRNELVEAPFQVPRRSMKPWAPFPEQVKGSHVYYEHNDNQIVSKSTACSSFGRQLFQPWQTLAWNESFQ